MIMIFILWFHLFFLYTTNSVSLVRSSIDEKKIFFLLLLLSLSFFYIYTIYHLLGILI